MCPHLKKILFICAKSTKLCYNNRRRSWTGCCNGSCRMEADSFIKVETTEEMDMALTLQELLEQTRDKFHLKFLSGENKNALDYVITWVHMISDISISEFFWGNELIVTSGFSCQTEGELMSFIDTLIERNSSGVVLNMGKYIQEVPKSVIDHCREKNFPLITMPWHISQTEFVRDCCSRITNSSRDDADLARTLIKIIRSPQETGVYHDRLAEQFQEEKGFQLLAVDISISDDLRANIVDERSILRLHTALREFEFRYFSFRYKSRFVLLLNTMDTQDAESAAQWVLECVKESLPDNPVCVGIGEPAEDFQHLADSYHEAVSAVRRAFFQKEEVVCFRDMGFYKLLYSVPNRSMLKDYYQETMAVLLAHDEKYGSSYVETLFRYLQADGSLQQVAEEMFTHRNTVNYRMGKIRELLGCDLATQEERMPYLLAYYVGQVIGKQG